MSAKFVICLAMCVLSSVSAGVIPVAAPLAAAGVVAPYATSYNAHTVNHAIAAPYVAAAPVLAPAAKLVAAPGVAAPLAYSAYTGLPAFGAYSAYNGFPASYVI
ncbi:cuticle protein 21.3-like [Malaya genurostris]|uniref:cuticle protein 21.3-like n=1 Tax=Malaya genurostris TaxID=325434 RepID=UPI0026F3F454|nr:cuticle protein 21.3-like [Malaya genurostris]